MAIEEFLQQMIVAGHTAIFQWIAVYVACGIGLIQMIVKIVDKKNSISVRRAFVVIYVILTVIMTLCFSQVLSVMQNQNKWANQMPIDLQNLFYESRSIFSNFIVGNRVSFSIIEWIFIVINPVLLILFLFGIYRLAGKRISKKIEISENGKKEKVATMSRDSEEIGILAGLLDFYSDKSNTHGSFVVAGVFGMYALLAFYREMAFEGFTISYVALLLIEIYAFANFSYYGAYAHRIAQKLTEGRELDITVEDREIMGTLVKSFYWFRTKIVDYRIQFPLLGVLWVCSAVLPLFFRILN
jgi:hypothetical protein